MKIVTRKDMVKNQQLYCRMTQGSQEKIQGLEGNDITYKREIKIKGPEISIEEHASVPQQKFPTKKRKVLI